jgi:hypothetical protein
VGLRKLLSRQPAEDPLERLAELGRETAHHPAPAFAELATEGAAAPISPVSVDERVVEISVAKAKRAESPRSRSGYVWVSRASRSKRAAWADFVNQRF